MSHSSSVAAAAPLSQADLIDALADVGCYPHPVDLVIRVETHSAYVLLAGDYAYKIKKALDLGFLDFSTLARRRHFCAEELRLNRRLVPQLYLGVVPIVVGPAGPRIGAGPEDGEAVEYAVRMVRFPQNALLDICLARGEVPPAQVDAVADRVADFHGRIEAAAPGDGYGTPVAVWAPMAQNFDQMREFPAVAGEAGRLAELEAWSRASYERLADLLAARLAGGRVRECHGDLHLGNIAWLDDGPAIFDAIDFNPNLRWIDVISEIAFLVMDLVERGRPDYAWRSLNRYLEGTGDYGGLALLPFYHVYRAIVRAKVAAIRAAQEDPVAGARELAECRRYLDHAQATAAPGQPRLILLHGFSGSGKSWLGEGLVERLGAIRLRSDVERKRLHGLAAQAVSASAVAGGIYGAADTDSTYHRLADLARQVLAAGYPAVVDAASLLAGQREIFRRLAADLGVPFLLLDCVAPEALLRQRLACRQAAGDDASEAGLAVLAYQLASREALTPAEAASCLRIDTSGDFPADLPERIRAWPGSGAA